MAGSHLPSGETEAQARGGSLSFSFQYISNISRTAKVRNEKSTSIPFLAFAGCRVNLWLTMKSKKRVGTTGYDSQVKELWRAEAQGLGPVPVHSRELLPCYQLGGSTLPMPISVTVTHLQALLIIIHLLTLMCL